MEEIIPVVAIIAVFGSSILLVKVITNYFLKRKMIDKGLASEEIANLLKEDQGESKYGGLKWGMITLAAGIGLIIINFVPYDGDTPFPYGVLAICISIGFLTYYNMVKRD